MPQDKNRTHTPDINEFSQNGDSIVNIRKNFEEARERRKKTALNLKARNAEMRKKMQEKHNAKPLIPLVPPSPASKPAPKLIVNSRIINPAQKQAPSFESPHLGQKFRYIGTQIQSKHIEKPPIQLQTPSFSPKSGEEKKLLPGSWGDNNKLEIHPSNQNDQSLLVQAEPIPPQVAEPAPLVLAAPAPLAARAPVFPTPTKKIPLFSFKTLQEKLRLPRLQRSLVLFAITLLILSIGVNGLKSIQRILDVKHALMQKASQAFAFADQGKAQALEFDFTSAQTNFTQASEQFSQAQKQISAVGVIVNQLVNILPTHIVKQYGQDLLGSGESLSNAGKQLSQSAQILTNELSLGDHVDIKESFIKQLTTPGESEPQKKAQTPSSETAQKSSLTAILADSTSHLDSAIKEIENAQRQMKHINAQLLPQSMKEQFNRINDFTGTIHKSLRTGSELSHFFLDLVGSKQQKRYLLTFNNNNEMRGTFGFIGTYALVDIDQGNVTNIEVDDIYNLDGQLKEKINPPEPIAHLTPRWYLHDANYFLDFPTSARTMEWFFEKAGGPTVDGVISITPGVIQELLGVSGPIDMPEYNTTITKENFISQTQQEVENEYNRQLNRPKKFLADLAPKLFAKLFDDKQAMQKLLPIMEKSLTEKQMGMYFFDESLQKRAQQFNWTAEVKATDKDYLAVVDNNIGGGKTDLMIDTDIDEEIMIQDDGSIIKKVSIKRTHTGKKEGFSVKNIDWMKVYVPLGSVLLSAKGFEPNYHIERNKDYVNDPIILKQETESSIHKESETRMFEETGKTVFGNWTTVEPQQTTTIELLYRLPFSIQLSTVMTHAQSYSLLLQKQPGSKDHAHTLTISYPPSMKPAFLYPTHTTHDEQSRRIMIKNSMTRDQYMAVTFIHR